MRFYADLHVHSYYSRATSKQANIEGLYLWASRKGIQVVGTGDFTHPGWLAELEERLEETEPGLYMPKNADELDARLPQALRIRPRFMLSVEISSIYKKADRVRKVHTVILMPDLQSARAFHAALDKLGNVRSDGRPILGLDPKEILKIAKSVHGDCEVIPAHIWTPWFSTLGAKSGFDSIEECYEEESHHIHALETGLSSDPTMNYRVSALDKYTLVSHSDAHSPAKLGREADILNTSLAYHSIVQAIRNPDLGFEGTVEFYPEEGKYHFDGHRKCGVVLTPEEAVELGGVCPVCEKPLTMGVMHRVLELADRGEGYKPMGKPRELHQIPLPEVLGELNRVGAGSKKVAMAYERLLAASGPELPLLLDKPFEEIEEVTPTLITAIKRLREGRVHKEPGFDGVFGKITVFAPGELDELRSQGLLIGFGPVKRAAKKPGAEKVAKIKIEHDKPGAKKLTQAQQDAINCTGDCAVIAGPGTGKTFVLTQRIARLVETGAPPASILAVTFTNAAAIEIRRRLRTLMGQQADAVRVMTLHAFGREMAVKLWPDAELALEKEQMDLLRQTFRMGVKEAGDCLDAIGLYKAGAGEKPRCFQRYQDALEQQGKLDMDDLIWRVATAMDSDMTALRDQGVKHLLVDEIQDINPAQARLILRIRDAGAELFVIGDPQQSIYGFRGSMADAVDFLAERVPGMRRMGLEWTFRMTRELVDFSTPLRTDGARFMTSGHGPKPRFLCFRTPMQEAIFIAKETARLLGGLGMQDDRNEEPLSLGDIAVLGRTKRVLARVKETLGIEGIPVVEGGGNADPLTVAAMFMETWMGRASLDELNGIMESRGIKTEGAMKKAVDMVVAGRPTGKDELRRLWDLLSTAMDQQGGGALPDMDDLVRDPDPRDLLDALNMMTRVDALNLARTGVSLLTLHASKGLEFKAVFIVGVQDGLIPFERARTAPELAEERRLFHVGVTRASKWLYMTSVRNRGLAGLNVQPGRSGLLNLVPETSFEDTRVQVPKKQVKQDEQLELF